MIKKYALFYHSEKSFEKLNWYDMDILDFSSVAGEVNNFTHIVVISAMSIGGVCWMNNELYNHQIFLHIGLYVYYLLQNLCTQHVPE